MSRFAMVPRSGLPGGPSGDPDHALDELWVLSRLHDGMRPGSYLVASERSPFPDGMGLEVRWLAGRHLVLGSLGPEDLGD